MQSRVLLGPGKFHVVVLVFNGVQRLWGLTAFNKKRTYGYTAALIFLKKNILHETIAYLPLASVAAARLSPATVDDRERTGTHDACLTGRLTGKH